jgi:hypothetical protein
MHEIFQVRVPFFRRFSWWIRLLHLNLVKTLELHQPIHIVAFGETVDHL